MNATDFCTEDGPCWFHAENRDKADDPCPGNFKTKQATWERERIKNGIDDIVRSLLTEIRIVMVRDQLQGRMMEDLVSRLWQVVDPPKKVRRARRR